MDNTNRFSRPNSSVTVLITMCLLVFSLAFADGDSRKPTPAEKDFHKTVLGAFARAIPPGPEGWEKTGSSTEVAELREIYSDKDQPFKIDYCAEWQNSKKMQEAQMQLNQELMKLAKKPGFTGEGVEELQRKLEPQDVKVRIDISANVWSQGIYEKASPAPAIAGGLVYKSQGEYKSGWREGSTYVFLGKNWKPDNRGGTYINFALDKNKTSSTVIENLVVKVQAAPNRADQIIQKTDWEALKAMIKK
jgi:hypothetical protein